MTDQRYHHDYGSLKKKGMTVKATVGLLGAFVVMVGLGLAYFESTQSVGIIVVVAGIVLLFSTTVVP